LDIFAYLFIEAEIFAEVVKDILDVVGIVVDHLRLGQDVLQLGF